MAFTEVTGDLFDQEATHLVCPINCVGAFGKGVAEAVKARWPDVFKQYRSAIGQLVRWPCHLIHAFETTDGPSVVLVPTKIDWRAPSPKWLVEENIRNLAGWCLVNQVSSLAMPAIGCGSWTGQLSYEEDVKPLLVEVFDNHPTQVTLCLLG